ncbi:MAG: Dihydroneopterin aldolase [Methanoregulaceae archaeon PtaB.Bin108]|jgi:hypothetical protein|nr:MAG: Dihydroneopterin aldolase [Methanoregulaceae archaeon PtaB.Bin108]OPY41319.1 MAG: Dihydroneopterin aldolase [Methanoregulaceae archaeon PtaU1.Bin222]
MHTAREQAIFEAGIKLGALYHQWVGTPVSPEIASSLESAIQKSVKLQPHVEKIRVRLDRSLMEPNVFGYSELRGLMFDVEITTRVEEESCRARLIRKDEYPMMEIVE